MSPNQTLHGIFRPSGRKNHESDRLGNVDGMEIGTKIVVLLMGIVFLGYSVNSASRGQIAYKIFVTRKEDQPVWFWVQVCVCGLIGIGMVVAEIIALVR